MRRVLRPLLVCIMLGSLLTGCATGSRMDLNWQHMGVRPDEPALEITKTSCEEYAAYVTYTQQLMEAYHSRATHNRVWIYVAGITGLGVIAATGGLAAVAAAGVGTLALLSISGGFTAGAFSVIDNADLAKSYTIAAKRVDTALSEADALLPSEGRYGNLGACGDALIKLKADVTEARTILEASRTDVAVGALDRAREAQKTLNAMLASQQDANTTQVTRSAEISALNGKMDVVSVKAGDRVTLTVSNGQLDRVAPNTIKALVGSRSADLADQFPAKTGDFEYTVTILVPPQPSGDQGSGYRPVLVVGPSKQRIQAKPGLLLKYQ
jgi:hypothetical protein